MKKSNSNNNISSILNVLGITPQIIVLFLLLILLIGIMIGIFVKHKDSNIVTNVVPAVEKDPEFTDDGKKDTFVKEEETELKEKEPSAFEQYSIKMEKTDKPVIAIIIDDMGVDMIRTQKILKLNHPLTVSYLTYAPNLQSQINYATDAGKEILLHVPMQALNDNYDYGGEYLSTNNSKVRNLEILNSQLNKVTGYIGINNHMGSRFTSDESQLSAVINEIKKRGIAFVDSKTSSQSKGDKLAKEIGIYYTTRDIFIDDSSKEEDIVKSLIQLERLAKKRGFAVAIGHPRTNTLKVMEAWLDGLEAKGFELVPISYIIKNYPKF